MFFLKTSKTETRNPSDSEHTRAVGCLRIILLRVITFPASRESVKEAQTVLTAKFTEFILEDGGCFGCLSFFPIRVDVAGMLERKQSFLCLFPLRLERST